MTTTELAALDFVVSVFPAGQQGRIRDLVAEYGEAHRTYTLAKDRLQAVLSGAISQTTPVTLPPAEPADTPAPKTAKPVVKSATTRSKPTRALLGGTALFVYDTLVGLGSDRAPAARADVLTYVIPPNLNAAMYQAHLGDFTKAVTALSTLGLVIETDGHLAHVPGRRVGYEHLHLVAVAMCRTARLGPQSAAEIIAAAHASAGLRGSRAEPGRVYRAVTENNGARFMVRVPGDPEKWTLKPGTLASDPPINFLSDEPGFIPVPPK